jgi:hypothetical protein
VVGVAAEGPEQVVVPAAAVEPVRAGAADAGS